jgi:hypothetical protein
MEAVKVKKEEGGAAEAEPEVKMVEKGKRPARSLEACALLRPSLSFVCEGVLRMLAAAAAAQTCPQLAVHGSMPTDRA